jgi:hypothetical protein
MVSWRLHVAVCIFISWIALLKLNISLSILVISHGRVILQGHVNGIICFSGRRYLACSKTGILGCSKQLGNVQHFVIARLYSVLSNDSKTLEVVLEHNRSMQAADTGPLHANDEILISGIQVKENTRDKFFHSSWHIPSGNESQKLEELLAKCIAVAARTFAILLATVILVL